LRLGHLSPDRKGGAGMHVEEMKRRNAVACAEIDRLKAALFA
jgi:hypothetical protein